ncbi:hypothetical protein FSST1_011746 [Fusarium sambucinum]
MSTALNTLFPGVTLVTRASSGIINLQFAAFILNPLHIYKALVAKWLFLLPQKDVLSLCYSTKTEEGWEKENTIWSVAKDAEVYPFESDKLDTDQVLKNMSLAVDRFGRIDYADNCDEFDQVLDATFQGSWLYALEELIKVILYWVSN